LRLVVVDGFGPHVPRPDGLCVALDRRAAALPSPAYTCSIYPERPQACADFAVAGDACLTARRRVGLSV
jgi:Fe-S-cluster containining protein